ncbi:Peptidyl-prolyl cis-trans isomerase CWC27 like protein [Eufriesea mexicana]|uniref:Peptidyl-prolyl cis-trans isomerase n=1 Tax=Eufriesea mexicana TaxID=516756 RepID=A0A310S433_9HYME|nr:Peptidyl-prolyl cis-trans isomerase CWC27 like protein [Eufriesea mexicana]
MRTTVGDVELELWTKETTKAYYYDDTIVHTIIKGFITQGDDPTGTGDGGNIYGEPFKNEFCARLRFCGQGLIAMANAAKGDNTSQFLLTLSSAPDLKNKHTIFGKVIGETIYNLLKLEQALVFENDKPLYPPRLIKPIILNNPFFDITRRIIGTGNTGKDEEESVILNKRFSGEGKSAHDHLSDSRLSSQPAVEPSGLANKKGRKAAVAIGKMTTKAMKERIKNTLRDTKKKPKKVQNYKIDDVEDDQDIKENEYRIKNSILGLAQEKAEGVHDRRYQELL